MRPDVEVPFLQVAAGARVDRRIRVRLGVARQRNLRRHRGQRGIDHAHRRNCRDGRLLLESTLRGRPRRDAEHNDEQHSDGNHGYADPGTLAKTVRARRLHRRTSRTLARSCTHVRVPLRARFSTAGHTFSLRAHVAHAPAAMCSLLGSVTVPVRFFPPCNKLKTAGTKISVAIVAKNNPPITARPSGAFCSPPSPAPNAMGIMPMIIASAVIMTGRNRVAPASMAAAT